MDKKKSGKGGKRSAPKSEEDFLWECSICTYKHNPEAFKCMMCGVSKGTSTRKSRINPDHLAVQVQQALLPQQPQKQRGGHGESSGSAGAAATSGAGDTAAAGGAEGEAGAGPSSSSSSKKRNNYPKQRKPRTPKLKSQLENIDPSSATVHEITVDGVTVQITEYRQRKAAAVQQSREGSSSREPLNNSKNGNGDNKNASDDESD